MGSSHATRVKAQAVAQVLCDALALLGIVAVVAWLSALVTLGALVAPQVFRHVSAPENAAVMARIFRNYDSVALACGALALSSELLLAWLRAEFLRSDALRVLLLTLLVAAVVGGRPSRLFCEGYSQKLFMNALSNDSNSRSIRSRRSSTARRCVRMHSAVMTPIRMSACHN